MINWIKSKFEKDPDPALTKLKTITKDGVKYSKLNEDEQIFLILRLANRSHDEISIALSCSLSKVALMESSAIKKLS